MVQRERQVVYMCDLLNHPQPKSIENVGNMSTKKICSNENRTNLSDRVKRVAYALKLFQFKQRLLYKCLRLGKHFKVTNESYRSVICSGCGAYHQNLGDDEVYNCEYCNRVISRDLNGAINILLKSLE